MGERGLGIRSGLNKLGWEETDFPIICNPCLGDNPYIRMTKDKYGRSCRICDRPFTVFKWRPSRSTKPKMVEICQTCAKLKNTCQSCLRDFDFRMSMTERDQFLGDKRIETPAFEANRDYWAEQANRNLARLILPYDEQPPALDEIMKEPRIIPASNPEAPSVIAGTSTNNDQPDTGTVIDLMTKQEFKPQGLLPPDDPKITSLYISHMTLDITAGDIKDLFEKYGPVQSVKVMEHGQSCFVNFQHRKSADDALNSLYNNLVVKDIELKVQWARQGNAKYSLGNLLKNIKPIQEKKNYQSPQDFEGRPLPPQMPPSKVPTSIQLENQFLLEIMDHQAKTKYPSQNPYFNGGTKQQYAQLKQ